MEPLGDIVMVSESGQKRATLTVYPAGPRRQIESPRRLSGQNPPPRGSIAEIDRSQTRESQDPAFRQQNGPGAMWWYLLYFAVAANAVAFTSPAATITSDKQNAAFAIPEPTKVAVEDGRARKLVRRAITTEAPASVCGFFAGSKRQIPSPESKVYKSRLACYNSNACVFHSSNANFPAMVGCCPTVSTTTPCTFISTCYGSSQLAATSSLRTYSNDPFVMLCTGDQDLHCLTRTWPGLAIADYKCTHSASSDAETMFTIGSLVDVTIDADQTTETMTISWVDDSVLLAVRGPSATVTTGTETTVPGNETARPRPGDDGGDSDEDSDSKPSTGAIVGGVVGGVGGVLVIVIVVLFVWRSKRKPAAETTETAPDKVADPEPPSPFDGGDTEPMIHEMHAIDTRRRQELMPERTYVEMPLPEVRHQLE
ncbi:hypothetical protein EMPG_10349 [Blastomyces silverae]|uniref:Uncharacterized protein n=1 Tax=Blastomyces silverae TaxID=2060906 RepID=A0A0H1B451_9EURO|nr:hypothetical protein EMPG_10349 [Blastomyces silverae]